MTGDGVNSYPPDPGATNELWGWSDVGELRPARFAGSNLTG